MANENPLTSHILDTTRGKPATNVSSILSKFENNEWKFITQQHTNEDGRLTKLISSAEFTEGVYKLKFDTKTYYKKLGYETFYPFVEIVFEIKNPEEHYHVPLLLSPFGYSTYRGS